MFESYSTALTFFFGIFWATILSKVPDEYKLFLVDKGFKSWFIGILFLNIYPLILLFILFKTSSIIPKNDKTIMTLCAAIASLSVFSALFFLRAMIRGCFDMMKYNSTEQRSLSEKFGLKKEKDEWSSVVIGLLYLFGWPLVAILAGRSVG